MEKLRKEKFIEVLKNGNRKNENIQTMRGSKSSTSTIQEIM